MFTKFKAINFKIIQMIIFIAAKFQGSAYILQSTFARQLKAHLFRSTEWHMSAARLSFFKAALFISNFIIIIIIIIIITIKCLSHTQHLAFGIKNMWCQEFEIH